MKLGLALLSILVLVGCVNAFSRVKRDDQSVDLVERRLVDNKTLTLGADSVSAINSRTKLFTARRYPKFEGLSNEELKNFLGGRSSEESLAHITSRHKRQIQNTDDDQETPTSDTVPPTSFDVSVQWPQCKKVFEAIQDQSNCASSWAVASASIMSDRRCIRYNGTAGARISAWDLMSCWNGCMGGYPFEAMAHYTNVGVVTGGPYGGGGCKPYQIAPGASSQPTTTGPCSQTCQSSYTVNTYANDLKKGVQPKYIVYDVVGIQNEIMARGPVTALVVAFQDFYQYSSGIYHHTTGDFVGHQTVRIVGWGEENGVKYWKAANSWGTSWGEGGFFRILRGVSESGIEALVVVVRALKD